MALLQARVEELERRAAACQARPKNTMLSTQAVPHTGAQQVSLQLFYLDSALFNHFHFTVDPVRIPVPEEISRTLGENNLCSLLTHYFETIHTWMPILSKVRLKRLLDRSRDQVSADLALLLCCIKLADEAPAAEKPASASPLYILVKNYHLQLEMAGMQSLMMLQAELFIAVYELGHAIYPAAYSTIAHCARQGISIGIHNQSSPQILYLTQGWTEWEERLRMWWFILILDRYVTVGSKLRPLCTDDPKKDTVLPADDRTWDQGEMVSPERLLVSYPTTATASPFARLAQAANLMGKVIRHCNDQDEELNFIIEEMSILHQTLSSLLDLTMFDNSGKCDAALAVCFSSLMKLHDHHSCDSFIKNDTQLGADSRISIRECTEQSFQTTKDLSLQIVSFAEALEQQVLASGFDQFCPLVLHCIYQAAISFAYLEIVTDDERYTIGKAVCRRALQISNRRWRAGGAYMDIIASTETLFD